MSSPSLPIERIVRDFILLISPYVENLGYHDIQSLCKEILSLDALVDNDPTPFLIQSAAKEETTEVEELTTKSLMSTLENCKGQAATKREALLSKGKQYQVPFVSQNEKTNHQVSDHMDIIVSFNRDILYHNLPPSLLLRIIYSSAFSHSLCLTQYCLYLY